jgi:hypothetical protein
MVDIRADEVRVGDVISLYGKTIEAVAVRRRDDKLYEIGTYLDGSTDNQSTENRKSFTLGVCWKEIKLVGRPWPGSTDASVFASEILDMAKMMLEKGPDDPNFRGRVATIQRCLDIIKLGKAHDEFMRQRDKA